MVCTRTHTREETFYSEVPLDIMTKSFWFTCDIPSELHSVSHWDNDLYKDSQNGKLNMGTWITLPSYSKAHDTRPLANIIYFHPENTVVKRQIFSWIRNLCSYIIHDDKKEGDSPFKKQ